MDYLPESYSDFSLSPIVSYYFLVNFSFSSLIFNVDCSCFPSFSFNFHEVCSNRESNNQRSTNTSVSIDCRSSLVSYNNDARCAATIARQLLMIRAACLPIYFLFIL